MRLAAVIPALDERARIAGAVARAGQLADAVIVVDGGSRDGTRELARDAGATVLRSRPGRALQMNAGAAACADADVLWFVHADVRLPVDGRAAIEAALADPTVVAGAFRTRTVSDAGPTIWAPILPLADARASYTRLPYGDQALFVRRSAFDRVGGFPPVPIMEDVELAARLRAVGKLVVRPERVEVSARRYLARPVYTSAVMNLYPALWRLGVSPERLARWYGRVR